MTELLLKGGRVIDPATDLDRTGDVLVRDGVIVALSDTPLPPAEDTFDCEGCIVSPGLIDIHVHFRDPDESGHHQETIASGSAAAAAKSQIARPRSSSRPPFTAMPSNRRRPVVTGTTSRPLRRRS
ncbi:MAG: hypothetical protein QF781_10430, partial [Phycisphaerales bacterium]|nr:hypothetical protein [Phycisphaerales bacterium]